MRIRVGVRVWVRVRSGLRARVRVGIGVRLISSMRLLMLPHCSSPPNAQ